MKIMETSNEKPWFLRHWESPSEKKARLEREADRKIQRWTLIATVVGGAIGLLGIIVAIALSKGWL